MVQYGKQVENSTEQIFPCCQVMQITSIYFSLCCLLFEIINHVFFQLYPIFLWIIVMSGIVKLQLLHEEELPCGLRDQIIQSCPDLWPPPHLTVPNQARTNPTVTIPNVIPGQPYFETSSSKWKELQIKDSKVYRGIQESLCLNSSVSSQYAGFVPIISSCSVYESRNMRMAVESFVYYCFQVVHSF